MTITLHSATVTPDDVYIVYDTTRQIGLWKKSRDYHKAAAMWLEAQDRIRVVHRLLSGLDIHERNNTKLPDTINIVATIEFLLANCWGPDAPLVLKHPLLIKALQYFNDGHTPFAAARRVCDGELKVAKAAERDALKALKAKKGAGPDDPLRHDWVQKWFHVLNLMS